VTTSQEPGAREDPACLATTVATVDLLEMFFQLRRVKAAMAAEIDRSLRAKHGLTFEAYDAMTVIGEQAEGCDETALARTLGLTADDIEAVVDSLVSSGYAGRTARLDGAQPPAVMLTLRGRLVLNRAGRTVDQELSRRMGTVVSPEDLAPLEDALAVLRRRPPRGGGRSRAVCVSGAAQCIVVDA
jgi:DNA-binding MarR family transcriptional regulator